MNEVNKSWLNSQQFIWCPGCPMIWLTVSIAQHFEKWDFKKENTWLVSGIGCAGRIAGYFDCNTAHTTHGRSIPVSEGIKLSSPDKEVFVVSGDGDLLSIGLSHLIHAARRNIGLKVICVNNQLYAMTGGQASPTTPTDLTTKNYPSGRQYPALPTRELLTSFDHVYYRQVDAYQVKEFKQAMDELYRHQGFGFIELRAVCLTNDPRIREADDNKN